MAKRTQQLEHVLKVLNEELSERGFTHASFTVGTDACDNVVDLETPNDVFLFEEIEFFYKSMKRLKDMYENG